MRIVLSFICLLFLTANTCKENENCHYDLIIKNNTGDSIKMALKYMYDENCALQGVTIKAGETYSEHSYKQCWEDRLTGGKTHEIYIVDPAKFNDQNIFYDCDSIEVKNKVLKHYILTLDELKKTNFLLIYE